MDAPGVESRTVEVQTTDGRGRRSETELAYQVAGEGPPVVLLHGIGLDSATVSWRYTIPALAENHRVYALDFPGHGESGRPRVRYTHEYFLDVLRSFLSETGLGGAPLVGISMGGCVALAYALQNETDVEKLVLVDSYGLGEDARWRAAANVLLRVPMAYPQWWRTIGACHQSVRGHLQGLTAGRPSDTLVSDVYETVQDQSGVRALSSWQRSEFRASGLKTCHLDRLDELEAPALYVHGVEDPLLPASWSRRAAEVTDGELALFDDCGHWPTREAPDRFNRTVASFLN